MYGKWINRRMLKRFLLLIALSLMMTVYFQYSNWSMQQVTRRLIRQMEETTQNTSEKNTSTRKLLDHFDFYWSHRRATFGLSLFFQKAAKHVSLLYAYEFDNEYSIVHVPYLAGAKVWCRYFDENLTEISQSIESFSHPSYLVNCPRVSGTYKISLSVSENGNYDYPISMMNRYNIEQKYELSMCLSPIFGKEPKWLLLSELVEHYKLQGVSHFYVYVYQIDEYSRAMLEDYDRTGEVTIINLSDRYGISFVQWQVLAYRDCNLRTKFESRWLLFADLDERITMTGYNGTILKYMQSLKNPENIGAVVFRQRWIMKTEIMPAKYENTSQLLEWMPTLRWHNTSSFGPPGHTVKTITNPLKVYETYVHGPKTYYPGTNTEIDVNPEDGVVRHYRDQQLGKWGVKWLKTVARFGPFSRTDYPESHQSELIKNVRKRVESVYSNYRMKLEE